MYTQLYIFFFFKFQMITLPILQFSLNYISSLSNFMKRVRLWCSMKCFMYISSELRVTSTYFFVLSKCLNIFIVKIILIGDSITKQNLMKGLSLFCSCFSIHLAFLHGTNPNWSADGWCSNPTILSKLQDFEVFHASHIN